MKTDDELISHWKDQPAPLLGLMHAFHDRDGFLSDEVLRAISQGLSIPIAELYATTSFYHHFSTSPPGKTIPRVCTGPICTLRGAHKLVDELDTVSEMPCAGRCDIPVPALIGDNILTIVSSDNMVNEPSPLPLPNPSKRDECVFANIRSPGRRELSGYLCTGGYEALTLASNMSNTEVIDCIEGSGLAGRGGAGFPTGQKWRAVAEAQGEPKYIICNADEGEPGCFKDRTLLDYDPHAIIEGMLIASLATGAKIGFIYLRYEYPETAVILEDALAEARNAGYLSTTSFDIHLRRGAGAYICGEEGSLINSLEGKHPYPRNRPPFPVTHGFEQKPTAVNNVETLAAIAPIIRHGSKWYKDLGIGGHNGTKLISLSGDIMIPGNYEIPIGLPLSTLLYDWAGGPKKGRTLQAVTMAGLSGGFLAGNDLDTTLDDQDLRARGSFLGAGGIMVFDDSRNMVDLARQAMQFFAEESCGKCFPCRIGTHRIHERLSNVSSDLKFEAWQSEVQDIGTVMAATSACGLGTAAPNISNSLLKYFPEQVEKYLSKSLVKD